MTRVAIFVASLAVVAIGIHLSRQISGCTGSFRFQYTSALSAIYGGRADGELCARLVMELLDLDVAAAKLGLSKDHLRRRLRTDVFSASAHQPDCRVTYRGRDDSETMVVLNVLVATLVETLVRSAEEDRRQVQRFLREKLAEITEKRLVAESSDATIVRGLERQIEQLNELLEATPEKHTAVSCSDYMKRVGDRPFQSTQQVRALELQCRESKPIGISAWPQLAERCESKT